ncbi:hypothetical protein DPMN_014622 [Dreissena polymorpha]|uniref:Uncharacterized protein n=1 Tax=Dreissena polymorpha TaxID=45954 RepID=A0A9D4S4Q6_DREPO|nr:hypothetical protein DPMN_014604 [Dreissena polymorpha]KAH3890538.1 hypothetical protein DPMN_014622 [Dreissena polymorpha]
MISSLKSTSGLTRGSGMTEEMQNLWTLSAPVKSEYNSAMHDFTDLAFSLSSDYKHSAE